MLGRSTILSKDIASAFKRGFGNFTPAKLPDLPYGYSALEPVISGEIMELHHKKHHNAYVTNYNAQVEQLLDAAAKNDASKVAALTQAIKFNGGGHVNHSIFWTNLAPQREGGGQRLGEDSILTQYIKRQFQSYDNLIAEFNKRTVAVQGSGWGWLAYDKTTDTLRLLELQNQDPVSTTGLIPLLGVDVWEHAYYLQYKNVRADYLKEIWKVVNWRNVEERLQAAKR